MAHSSRIGFLEESTFVASMLDANPNIDQEEQSFMINPFSKRYKDLQAILEPILKDAWSLVCLDRLMLCWDRMTVSTCDAVFLQTWWTSMTQLIQRTSNQSKASPFAAALFDTCIKIPKRPRQHDVFEKEHPCTCKRWAIKRTSEPAIERQSN